MIDLSLFDDNTDIDKLLRQNNFLEKGIENYLKFQKYPYFRWPAWIETITNRDSQKFCSLMPPLLINNSLNDYIAFSNFLSGDEIYIDPSGMISVSYDIWSLECWVMIGGVLFRPQGEIGSVKIKRDATNAVITSSWEHKLFILKQSVYGAKSNIDEAVLEIDCILNAAGRDAYMIVALRPYNNKIIGGITDAEYIKANRLLKVNGKKSIAIDEKPSFVLSGNTKEGDINFENDQESLTSNCKKGMSTLAMGFKLKKGNNLCNLRISLDRNGELVQGKINYGKLRSDFVEFSKFRINAGMNINTPDKLINRWFYSSKTSVLNIIDKDIFFQYNSSEYDCRNIFFIIFGYNRMGYAAEAKKYIDLLLNSYQINEKEINFKDAINVSYIINSFTDYFTHARDLDYLQLNYLDRLKKFGAYLFKYATGIKKLSDLETNTIDKCYIKNPFSVDLILLAYSLNQFAYLARCLGIFDDEKKFIKEFERIETIYIRSLEDYNNIRNRDEFFYHDLQSGYPFRLDNLTNENITTIIDGIMSYFDQKLLYNKSMGLDIFSSIIFISNLILQKDPRCIGLINELFNYGGEKLTLPEFLNPVSGNGSIGNGSSKLIGAMIFAMIRNLIFVDTKERLDIFPIPYESWFKPGVEIKIDDAPSRFGKINFLVKTTSNEIHFYFDKLPKYIPPDIMINLPFKAEIVEGEDFILKKIMHNSFIINGWPSIVRFIKK